jgi:hypothetical protein
MTTDEKYKIYFYYRHLIDNSLQKHLLDEEVYEDLYNACIGALFYAINEIGDNIKQMNDKDFKAFALFHIKSAINNILNERD